MRKSNLCAAGMFTCLCLITMHAFSQATFNIWPGIAPGSESWKQKEQTIKNTPVGTVILNVVTPTLTVYLPEKDKATGTCMIIAPGGGCIALAMKATDELATRLSQKGIAAFVLKYRLQEKKGEGMPKDLNEDTACQYGIADAVQSIKFVRQHALEWGISPAKLGFLGFSAGGQIACEAMLQNDTSSRPDFVALIYGAPFASMPLISANLPPVFMTWAQDDSIAGYAMERFYKALVSAGYHPEAHIFNAGGHGFAINKQGTSSDHWIDELDYWMQAEGFEEKERK
ncbi:MAG: alpha/beta hydrolase [Ginsengibacter sp.]